MNNKHFLSAAVIAALLSSTNAMAQAYVSADIGMSHASFGCEDGASCRTSDLAFGVTAGYKVVNGFSIELGYVDFGGAKFNYPPYAEVDSAAAWTLGVAYAVPVGNDVSIDLRLGAASVKASASANYAGDQVLSGTDTQSSPYYGLGLGYRVAKNVTIQGGALWTHAKFEDLTTNVRAITVGARYDF
jgi:hypothetical protein